MRIRPELPEIRKYRLGALDAVANSSIKLARYAREDELALDAGDRLTRREAGDGATKWARGRGVVPLP
jgi:hypothetical protein